MADTTFVTFNHTDVILAWRILQGNGKPQSFRAFASDLGISFQAVNFWQRGSSIPTLNTLNTIIDSFPPTSWQHHFAMDVRHCIYPELAPHSDLHHLLAAAHIQPS